MKKAISVLITVTLVASMAACTGSKDKPVENLPKESESAEIQTEVEEGELPDSDIGGSVEVYYYESMFYKDFLEEASAAFELKYPGTKINVTGFSKMPEYKTIETEDGSMITVTEGGSTEQEMNDYINRISTEVMSGGGPDILAMDILSYSKYAESGMLEDLKPHMEADNDFDISNYRSSILEGVRYKGGQYMVPLDFAFDFISLDKNRVSEDVQNKLREKGKFTYDELVDSVKDQFENDDSNARLIDFQGERYAFGYLLRSDYKKYIDVENKKVNFTDGSFSKLLNMVKEHGQKGYYTPSFETSGEMTQDFMDSWSMYYFKNQTQYMLKQIFYPYDETMDLGSYPPPKPEEVAGIIVNENGEAAFRSYQNYAVNANSKNKRLAWEFVKFMLSEDMQLSLKLLGIPVNNSAYAEYSTINLIKFPNYQEADNELGYEVNGFQIMEEQKYLDAHAAYLEWANKFIDTLSLYPIDDDTLSEMTSKARSAFFDGSRTADEAAATLQSQAELYLSE